MKNGSIRMFKFVNMKMMRLFLSGFSQSCEIVRHLFQSIEYDNCRCDWLSISFAPYQKHKRSLIFVWFCFVFDVFSGPVFIHFSVRFAYFFRFNILAPHDSLFL